MKRAGKTVARVVLISQTPLLTLVEGHEKMTGHLTGRSSSVEREQVGIFEAKTHFSEIVERILRDGRTIVVTRRGQPVVEISPSKERSGHARMSWSEALVTLDRLRGELPTMSWAEITELIAEDRDRCPTL
jgi:prevent-host-death family protein